MENASDRELLELVVAQVSKLTTEMVGMKAEMNEGFKQANDRIDKLENTVLRIEHNHGEKLSALFDGYKQNSEKLDRIEKVVADHDEFILKRIK